MRRCEGGVKKHGFIPVLTQISQARGLPLDKIDVKAEIGSTAGEIYKLLEKKGESDFREVKAELEKSGERGPLVAAALGWLLREDKLDIKATQDGLRVKLK